MPWPIVRAKTQPPLLRTGILRRPRLRAVLDRALAGRLTLIEADAGFGKSTLLADYVATAHRPWVWLRLDEGDSDPATFAAYLIEALRPHLPKSAVQSVGRSLNLVSDWPAAVRVLSRVLHKLRRELLIVLDDYHLLKAPSLGESMTRFIEGLPARVHLTILTRTRPDLPAAQWRLQGVATVAGPDDLRFTAPELRQLVVDLFGLPLSDAALQELAAKTEGWAAGIVLALHAVVERGPAEAERAIAALSGSSREIYEYLAQEALAGQPEDVRRFLVATATLSRFSIAFADALLASRNAQRIVELLEIRRLFIVPLDSERRWYRYHHLFAEFLQRVGVDHDSQWIRGIHAQAARLWEVQGDIQEALHHYVEAGEPGEAARLLGRVGLDLIARGQSETARRWLEVIPQQLWGAEPRLYLIQGVCDITRGEAASAATALEEARGRLRDAADAEGEARAARWLGHGLLQDTWPRGVDRLQRLIDDLEPRQHRFPDASRAIVLEIMGRTADMHGSFAQAEQLFRQAIAAARSGRDEAEEGDATRYLGRLLLTVGRFGEARAILEELTARYRRRGWAHEEAHLRLDLARLWASLGHMDESASNLAAAEMLAATVPCRVLHADVEVSRAEASVSRGARDAAARLLRQALEPGAIISRYPPDRIRARLLLAMLRRADDPEDAWRLANDAEEDVTLVGLFWRVPTLLVQGIIRHAAAPCLEAAAVAGRLNLAHWQAVALLRAAEFSGGDAPGDLRARVAAALRALTEEMWPFVAAQIGRGALEAYQDEPEIGFRVRRALAALPTTSTLAPRLVVRCLGPFEVRLGGAVLPPAVWRRASARRLLQFLLVQGRPVHREEIMDALWPQLDPRRAANHLRVALWHLRHGLELEGTQAYVFAAGSTVTLSRDRVDSDLERFRRAVASAAVTFETQRHAALVEAVQTYQGELFADSPYEEWATSHRDRLAQQYLDALAALAAMEEEEERWEPALAHWTALLERDPAAEHGHRGRIRCYLALGRTGDALRAFDECRRALAGLGATPSPETLRIRERIPAAIP